MGPPSRMMVSRQSEIPKVERPDALSQALSLARSQIRMAPKGTPADALLLEHAAKLGTGVVSNDRFRDWAAAFPSLAEEGVLVRGRWVDGTVRLDWPA